MASASAPAIEPALWMTAPSSSKYAPSSSRLSTSSSTSKTEIFFKRILARSVYRVRTARKTCTKLTDADAGNRGNSASGREASVREQRQAAPGLQQSLVALGVAKAHAAFGLVVAGSVEAGSR